MEATSAIDRKQLISLHNPVLEEADTLSPLTVGNGEFAFTADITGMQSLYDEYAENLPLCTMSQWGFHTTPVSKDRYAYTLEDLEMTEYEYQGRPVYYPKEKKAGNEEVYDWLRHNPHRLNLARIELLYKGNPVQKTLLSRIRQELHLYQGLLDSRYVLDGVPCHVQTLCSYEEDVLAFRIESDGIAAGDLSIRVSFPYGSSDISASDWRKAECHETRLLEKNGQDIRLKRILDKDNYYVRYQGEDKAEVLLAGHTLTINPESDKASFAFKIGFAGQEETLMEADSFRSAGIGKIEESARCGWERFWTKGGILRLNRSRDVRAWELERRIILSQYLMAVNSCGSAPPQETGLTCNSWYGKMHLEMYLWHCAWLPLWNHTSLLEKSFAWYQEHLPQARENAARNGYHGARWPKMITLDGIDCPSKIAPLLVWQQPHIIYMLELAYRREPSLDFLEKYWPLVEETAEFMVDFAVYDEKTGIYSLEPPLIPVQERYEPDQTRNPAFEVEYWHVTLHIAGEWAKRLNRSEEAQWRTVADAMAPVPVASGLYQGHEWCSETFTKVANDHPSMVGAYGLLKGERIEPELMRATLNQVLKCWEYSSLWGWDFAMMAMTAVRLGEPEKAIEILLKDTPKNRYVASGNNMQVSRKDLPLYLPGNGSLLLAIPLMAVGYPGCRRPCPGFPDNGDWVVECEGIQGYFQ